MLAAAAAAAVHHQHRTLNTGWDCTTHHNNTPLFLFYLLLHRDAAAATSDGGGWAGSCTIAEQDDVDDSFCPTVHTERIIGGAQLRFLYFTTFPCGVFVFGEMKRR